MLVCIVIFRGYSKMLDAPAHHQPTISTVPYVVTKYVAGRQRLVCQIAFADQRLLLDYFAPSEDCSAEKLVIHRHDIAGRRPGLPSQAGRALRRFDRVLAGELEMVRTVAPSPPSPGRGRGRPRAISVRAVVKPHPDMRTLARALLALSPEEIEQLHRGESLRVTTPPDVLLPVSLLGVGTD